MKTTIAVVGSSIAGSVCAIVLDQLGYDLTVFEKSSENISERGVGMWLPESLIKTLINRNMLSKDFRYINIYEKPIYTYDAKRDQENLLTIHPIQGSAINWQNLYDDLKRHCPEQKVIYNAQVTGIQENKQGAVQLTINDQEDFVFDYCVFADGVHSIGRKYLYPQIELAFANTIIWRGTLEADEKATQRLWEKGIYNVCERGHLLTYLIPNKNKDSAYQYKANWLFYEAVNDDHPLFAGRYEKARQNVIKGTMSPEYLDYLRNAAKKYFPSFARDMILNTEQPFIQAVHELLTPGNAVHNIALIGDAAVVLRPHAAAGAMKGIYNVLALEEQLKSSPDLKSALKNWSHSQLEYWSKRYKLAQDLGRLLVTDMPDWQRISKPEIDQLWDTVRSDLCWYAA